MDKAIFPASFDPVTKGHLDIIKRATNMVDTLYIAVCNNDDKVCYNDLATRLAKLKQATRDLANIKVITCEGLLTECARKLNIKYIIRSIRNSNDYEYEKNLEQIYKSQYINIECIYILADPKLAHISSTVTKQLIKLGGDVADYEV